MFFIVHFESTLGPKVRLSLYYLHNHVKEYMVHAEFTTTLPFIFLVSEIKTLFYEG